MAMEPRGTEVAEQVEISVAHGGIIHREEGIQTRESWKRLLSRQTPYDQEQSRQRNSTLAGVEDEPFHVLQDEVRVFTVEDKAQDKCKRAAKELAMLKISVRTRIHHE